MKKIISALLAAVLILTLLSANNYLGQQAVPMHSCENTSFDVITTTAPAQGETVPEETAPEEPVPEQPAPEAALSAAADTLTDGDYITLSQHLDVKKNKAKYFYAQITAFDTLRIGHGENTFGGSYVDITPSSITTYNYTKSANVTAAAEHGLLISGYITVQIDIDINASVTVTTESGSFTLSDIPWNGCSSSIFARSIGSELTDCIYQWFCSDLSRDIWVFGDSYLGLTDTARYPYYLLQQGYDNWLACGYPGANSASQLNSFKNLLVLETPVYAVWCLGMNDVDKADAINQNWLNCVTEFLALCEDHNITPILATIPSAWGSTSEDSNITAARNNSFKSAWVRESGYRFIDFESAVIAENGSGWKDGLLSTDGVHPTAAGAMVLAEQFVLDFPEIAQ